MRTTHKFDNWKRCACGATIEQVMDNIVSASCPNADEACKPAAPAPKDAALIEAMRRERERGGW